MDYKIFYQNAFNKNIAEIDSDVISEVNKVKERNKDFTAVANSIEKNLREKVDRLRSTVQQSFPDLYNRFENRFKEYNSDHLTCYFNYDFPDLAEKYGELTLKECAIELGTLESYSLAAINFPNSKAFLEAIYVLNKNQDQYTLNFDPNNSPENSELFYKMQKERFPGYGEKTGWEEAAIKEIKADPAEDLVSKFTEALNDLSPQKEMDNPTIEEDIIENEIRAINPQVKLFLLRQLYYLPQPIKNYFSIPELMKLIKILELSFDTTIFEKKPSDTSAYRPVNKGLDYYTQIKTREKIKSDAIKYLNLYGLTRFKEYITFHAK